MTTPAVDSTPEFHQTWHALMRQLELVLSLAHQQVPNRTEAMEAVIVSKFHLATGSARIDAATTPKGTYP